MHIPCAYSIEYDEKHMLDPFSYIKYDETCIPELFLTVPELQTEEFFIVFMSPFKTHVLTIFDHLVRICRWSFSTSSGILIRLISLFLKTLLS